MWPTVLCAAFGSLCRPQGILLAIPIFVEFVLPHLKTYKKDKAVLGLLCSAAPFSGFVVMAVVSLTVAGTPLAFLGIQSRWGRSYEAEGVLRALVSAIDYKGPPFDLIGLLFGISMLPFLWKRLPRSLAAYGTGMVLLPLLTGSILSIGRFISVSAPHFVCAAMMLRSRRKFAIALICVGLILQAFISRGALGWYFVG